MAKFRSYTYEMVDGYDVSDPAIAFYDELLAIADDLVELEVDIAEHHVDLTGIRSYSAIQEFERRYVSLVNDIQQAHEAIMTGRPRKLDRFDWNIAGNQNDVNRLQRRYAGMHSKLEGASARVSQLLESKQSAVHSRLSVTISTAAVIVSTLTLAVNLLFG